MTVTRQPVGILGGTFDPVHNGHLRLAMELVDDLSLDHVRLIPNGHPPHRHAPGATSGQRSKWIRVAIASEPRLCLDDRELLRQGPSWTVDTLAELKNDLPGQPLCLVMGRDVFAKLPEWHDWQGLFELTHIVLINRPEITAELQPQAQTQLDERYTDDLGALHKREAGLIHGYAPPPLAISASRIRALLAAGRSPRYLLPGRILDDIMDAGVYRHPEESQPTP